jgi:hypothetical protein
LIERSEASETGLFIGAGERGTPQLVQQEKVSDNNLGATLNDCVRRPISSCKVIGTTVSSAKLTEACVMWLTHDSRQHSLQIASLTQGDQR